MPSKIIIFCLCLVGSISSAFAGEINCGSVDIVEVLAGPKYGSMMKISNDQCGGHSGWICLDPDGEHMSAEESKRLYSFVLASHMASKKVDVRIFDDKTTSACGGPFLVLRDIRTSN